MYNLIHTKMPFTKRKVLCKYGYLKLCCCCCCFFLFIHSSSFFDSLISSLNLFRLLFFSLRRHILRLTYFFINFVCFDQWFILHGCVRMGGQPWRWCSIAISSNGAAFGWTFFIWSLKFRFANQPIKQKKMSQKIARDIQKKNWNFFEF